MDKNKILDIIKQLLAFGVGVICLIGGVVTGVLGQVYLNLEGPENLDMTIVLLVFGLALCIIDRVIVYLSKKSELKIISTLKGK